MQSKDLYNDKTLYENWKERVKEEGEEGISKNNSDILIDYINDMEIGVNVGKGTKKGGRSPRRLNTIRQKIKQIMRFLEDMENLTDIRKVTENQIVTLFHDMKNKMISRNGGHYRTGSYIAIFKSFWHWYMKKSRKQNKIVNDITEDLSGREETQAKFVYLTKENFDLMIPYFEKNEQLYLMFAWDTMLRPKEQLSLKVNNVFEKNGQVWVDIPDEISKSIGRSFNLLYCGDELKKYIKEKGLKPNDYLFDFSPEVLNNKLQRVAKQLFGEKLSDSRAGELYKNVTLYDIRHSSAIFFRVLAKNKKISLDALRQRGGWTDFKMLNYYTKFIGLDGEIDKNDLLIEEDKSKLEKEIEKLKEEKEKQEKLISEVRNELIKFKEEINRPIKIPLNDLKKLIKEQTKKSK